MSDTYGRGVTLTVFGESHGPAVGATVTGLAPGVPIDLDFMRAQMDLRRAKGKISTARAEADEVRIVSGMYRGAATGTALTLLIENTNTRSGDYAKTAALLRPGHADYTAYMKYGGHQDARGRGDSVGGVLETVLLGLPAGLGEPFFGSVESTLAALFFSIPAVKGVEFGLGFGFADRFGSTANDPFCMENGRVVTATNHNGGVNGGITNGMPVVVRTVVKPTPSIYIKQQTVDFAARQNAELQISGRHDPCILHRARVVQDSLAAFGVADLCGQHFGVRWQEGTAWNMD